MNSAGNNLVTDDRTRLGNDYVDKLTVLRMNKEFMISARKKQAISFVQFNGII